MLQKENRDKVLSLFFDNPVPEGIGFQLREISRKINLATTSVKNYLEELEKESLIIKKRHRIHNYPVYYANRDSDYFRFLKIINNIQFIKESGLLKFIKEECMPDTIILFGSFSEGEDIKGSDIDLYVQCKEKRLDLREFENRLKRKINILFSEKLNDLSKELKNNIINGIKLEGYLKLF